MKKKTVVPEAFRIAGLVQNGQIDMPVERAVRLACRDSFRSTRLLTKIIPQIEEVLKVGELPIPAHASEAVGPAFLDEPEYSDDGHRG